MAQRHILSVLDLDPAELLQLVERGIQMRSLPRDHRPLVGKTIGIYFRKTSTRTRTAFSAGAGRLGGHVVAYGPNDLQTNTGETVEDTARVLGSMLDVLVMRTAASLEEMRVFAAQPGLGVVNAMSEGEHPTQAIADLTTMREHFGRLEGLHVLYLGEGNNTAAALALAIARIPGMRLTLLTPEGYGLEPAVAARALELAAAHGAEVQERHAPDPPRGVDVVYTTRWQTTGTSKPDPDWRRAFEPFAVTSALMASASKPSGTVFMHDLPAMRGEDVEDAVLDGPQSIAWRQAENKLYSAAAVLEWCAADAAPAG
jgi:ornithine carbamoyltransferase